ncbi:MAG: PilZ domain-containing protein [Nitrospirota bacterium]
MRSDRKQERFIRRLETEFSADNKTYRGISSDLSLTGLFIRTNHAFAPGSVIDITIHLPEGVTSKLRGKVRRAFKTPFVALKNGMGIELTERDSNYINFIKTYLSEDEFKAPSEKAKTGTESAAKKEAPSGAVNQDFLILSCSKCGAKNKVPGSKISMGPKCGKCGSQLIILA